MNINWNNYLLNFPSLPVSMSSRIKPIVYVISALAIGILIYQTYRHFCKESTTHTKLSGRVSDNKPSNPQTRDSNPEVVKKEEVKDNKLTIPLKEESSQLIAISKITGEKSSNEKTAITFYKLVISSNHFASRIEFPTQNNLIKNFATTAELQAEVEEHANGTCPLLPSRIWSLIPKLLEHKRQHGSSIEKQLYATMTPTEFVNRLIEKRPLTFYTKEDICLLRNNQSFLGEFEEIGTDNEGALKLKDYQSYFEMSLSAFVSMFVPTHFINNGDRSNVGNVGKEDSFEPKGIFVGMVGARFEKPGFMEYAHMLVTREQNTAENGYGENADLANPKTAELRLWAELYKSKMGEQYAFPDYEKASEDTSGRYVPIKSGLFLDTFVYQERMKLVVESFLLKSNESAKQQGKQAYLHIVGLGLGAWAKHDCQAQLLVDVYADLLRTHQLDHISDIDFSWFLTVKECGGVQNEEMFENKEHSIKIHFSKRNPADKLIGENENKLLIAQYAWDSNSYPGNEYWKGLLSVSGDPAAACCSMIPELQNPEINPNVRAEHISIIG